MAADFRGDPSAALLEVLDPGAEPLVPGPLPGHASSTLTRRDVHRDRQRDAHDPACAARPHGSVAPAWIHAERKDRDRREVPRSPSNFKRSRPFEKKNDDLRRRRRFARSSSAITKEAGVRNLEREVASDVPQVGAEGWSPAKDLEGNTIEVTPEHRARPPRRSAVPAVLTTPKRKPEVGVATGLAWTEVGGEILTIECDAHARPRQAHPDRSARRRDAGVCTGGAVVHPFSRAEKLDIDPLFHRQATTSIVHMPGGRDPQGRTLRRHRPRHVARDLPVDRERR